MIITLQMQQPNCQQVCVASHTRPSCYPCCLGLYTLLDLAQRCNRFLLLGGSLGIFDTACTWLSRAYHWGNLRSDSIIYHFLLRSWRTTQTSPTVRFLSLSESSSLFTHNFVLITSCTLSSVTYDKFQAFLFYPNNVVPQSTYVFNTLSMSIQDLFCSELFSSVYG